MTVTTGSALLDHPRPTVPLRHFGISLGHLTEGSAEAWIRSLRLPEVAQACTHRAEFPFPHVAVSVALPLGVGLPAETAGSAFLEAAMAAGAAHATGRSGRALHFRGASAFSRPVTVHKILSNTDVVRVTAGTADARPGDVLDCGRGLTPHWVDGELTVRTGRRLDGVLVPLPGFRR
ncbi:hypothetical protein Q0Z83_034720 [Actinoplanes sichuanensis]|uniref:Uncharacterized protein n=1 Tax=Actinoplanes sichuanensis TaxID=512349 RepID=A0ABW4ASQ5_9ACTN|nr:hypothetical protein [Actinoplanes sichuanensis]BEL05281.1 hypothetical protein Q0Z83_034720 [Actinoplanes sichuanensis]